MWEHESFGNFGNPSMILHHHRTQEWPVRDRLHVIAAMNAYYRAWFSSDVEQRAVYAKIVRRAQELGIPTAGFTLRTYRALTLRRREIRAAARARRRRRGW
jgi:hypothetical protein